MSSKAGGAPRQKNAVLPTEMLEQQLSERLCTSTRFHRNLSLLRSVLRAPRAPPSAASAGGRGGGAAVAHGDVPGELPSSPPPPPLLPSGPLAVGALGLASVPTPQLCAARARIEAECEQLRARQKRALQPPMPALGAAPAAPSMKAARQRSPTTKKRQRVR